MGAGGIRDRGFDGKDAGTKRAGGGRDAAWEEGERGLRGGGKCRKDEVGGERDEMEGHGGELPTGGSSRGNQVSCVLGGGEMEWRKEIRAFNGGVEASFQMAADITKRKGTSLWEMSRSRKRRSDRPSHSLLRKNISGQY